MDASAARQLAHTGMIFVPSDSASIRPEPNRDAVHRDMCDALGASAAHVPVPTVVVAPSRLFDDVWRALMDNIWSDRLKNDYMAVHGTGRIEFVAKR